MYISNSFFILAFEQIELIFQCFKLLQNIWGFVVNEEWDVLRTRINLLLLLLVRYFRHIANACPYPIAAAERASV